MWSSSSRAWLGGVALIALAAPAPAPAAVDLAALQVTPQRGQSAEQARRDRYECHSWAVEQSGELPLAAPASADAASDDAHAKRAQRIDRVLTGAAIGAGLGGLVRATQHENPANGVLAGAAVGAAIGAATSDEAAKRRDRDAGADDAEPGDYLRALTACLEGRGYGVALPSAD
jgi:hypothetical protein